MLVRWVGAQELENLAQKPLVSTAAARCAGVIETKDWCIKPYLASIIGPPPCGELIQEKVSIPGASVTQVEGEPRD